MEPLVINWAKEEANNSAYSYLLLIIQFLSRLCNIFSQINCAEGMLPDDEL